MDKLHITITGDLGSGKSTVAKELCKRLHFNYFSTGTIQRELAASKSMNTLELNYLSEKEGSIDKYIDDKIIELNESDEPFVLDSRLAWHFIRKSFKVYLTVDPFKAAQRVNADTLRKNEPAVDDLDAKAKNLIERRAVEDRRFKNIYNVDCSDMKNFDVIIDTTNATVDEIVLQIIERYNRFAK